ncbi:hypothetical protein, partial [Buchananella hordeovulneris]|uniref:hypothetical protein n=1 Tax=Buchananella hordeovulneris TaxID=52770 RepID=UPI001C9E9C86
LASACSPATPDAGATATTPTAATNPADTASSSPTPTPSPTGSALGPVGTIAFQDGKVWLVTPEGDYTMNIPQGYEAKAANPESSTPPRVVSIHDDGTQIAYFYLNDSEVLPPQDELLSEFTYKMVNDPHIREDIASFAGNPAVALQIRTITDRLVIVYLYSKIGNKVWVMNITGTSQEQADDLIRQASESLTKQ